jgi:bisphosphoglycerate-independent phosphoglycerate mutase (AlkP superfamily)
MSASKLAAGASKVCLIAIDGWGLTDTVEGNAVLAAATPHMDSFAAAAAGDSSSGGDGDSGRLHMPLRAHGLDVGLPDGVMGNSEVGHLTMGAGRVDFQDLVRIDKAVSEGEFKSNARLQAAFASAATKSGRVHFAGLVSDGAVHSHIEHLKHFIVGGASVLVTFICVLCTLRTQISPSICTFTHYRMRRRKRMCPRRMCTSSPTGAIRRRRRHRATSRS